MERKEIKGSLAMSGKEWKCYRNSTLDEIKQLNDSLTDQEVQIILEIVQSINEGEKEYENHKDISEFTE